MHIYTHRQQHVPTLCFLLVYKDVRGVDEDTIASRETLKKKSQLIAESNAKKNPWKKKTTRM